MSRPKLSEETMSAIQKLDERLAEEPDTEHEHNLSEVLETPKGCRSRTTYYKIDCLIKLAVENLVSSENLVDELDVVK